MVSPGKLGHQTGLCIPDALCYMRNLDYDGSISFGETLQSLPDGTKYSCQTPTILASMRANFQTPAMVSDKEPMYVHLPQFWDARNRPSFCSEALSAAEICAPVVAKHHDVLAASSVDTEVKSECSTVDTADRSPGSPELERARPRIMQRSQDLVVTSALGQSELDKELKNTPSGQWHSRAGYRGAETATSDIQKGTLPSIGSAGHRLGRCKPCAFIGTKGCNSGTDCRFCHLCEAGEKKRRQKEKRAHFTAIRHARHAQNPQVTSRGNVLVSEN